MILKVFTKKDCPKCPAAKKFVKKLRVTGCRLRIEEHDASTVDGLAEASFYSVMATPSLVLCDDGGKELFGWRGTVPLLADFLKKIK